ncbi:MAG: DNRLRE domain-containing protein, partial [Terriglobales bacterium]
MKRRHFVLKAQKLQFLPALLLLLNLLATAAHAQITPLGDSYTNTANPTKNFGAATLLDVDGASQTTYIQFNLASIPSTASVSQATLKLYVNTVTTAGSFNVDYVNGAWAESTIDASNA